ncbi:MAG: hypothetical protein OEL88_04570 [Sterolibacteriaceae bacterium MAG5]|nr:hypothetical protein [Candidatus Nitricoxidireducens bremensis]
MRFLSALPLACLATVAHAIGLGAPSGTPTLGRPLRLEIPLLGHAGPPLAADCFQLTPVPGSADEYYFPRRARAYVEMSQGRPVVIVAANDVSQPVVEFRLTVTCGNSLTRDFTLLTMLPLLEAPKTAAQQPQPPAIRPAALPPPAPAAGDLLRPGQDTNLEALAREKYPNQPKAREKFKRMMQAANSSLIPSGEGFDLAPIPVGTELVIPKGLPERRYGPYVAPASATPRPQPAVQATTLPPAKTSTTQSADGAPKKAPPSQDRLVLDAAAAPPMSEAEASADMARLESIHAEQVKAQEALDERIVRAQEAFAEIKEYVLQTEARIRALEERNREQERRAAEAQVWQLAAAVLVGGMLGAGLLRAYPLILARRRKETAEIAAPAALPATPPAAPPAKQPTLVAAPPGPAGPTAFSALRSYGTAAADLADGPTTIAAEPPLGPATAKPSPIIEPLDFDFTPTATPAQPASQANGNTRPGGN